MVPHSSLVHPDPERPATEPALLELGVLAQEIQHVVVCGHSDCKVERKGLGCREKKGRLRIFVTFFRIFAAFCAFSWLFLCVLQAMNLLYSVHKEQRTETWNRETLEQSPLRAWMNRYNFLLVFFSFSPSSE